MFRNKSYTSFLNHCTTNSQKKHLQNYEQGHKKNDGSPAYKIDFVFDVRPGVVRRDTHTHTRLMWSVSYGEEPLQGTCARDLPVISETSQLTSFHLLPPARTLSLPSHTPVTPFNLQISPFSQTLKGPTVQHPLSPAAPLGLSPHRLTPRRSTRAGVCKLIMRDAAAASTERHV